MFRGLVGSPSFTPSGAKKISTVTMAKGTAARFMNGIRRPFGFLLRSDREAIHGSVTASKIRQMKVIRPRIVSAPKMIRPVGT